ncbi:hypothetical protein MKX03_003560 [Papaver bracteatum]|nr:hypothetical protein MKX03_003560 [Papaver bracteatum]
MEEIELQELESSTSSNGFTCEICVEIVPVSRQFKSMEMSGCLHPYCTDFFEKWCRVLCESLVLLDSTKGGLAYGRCYCPHRDCSELILSECVRTSRITISNCPNCKKLLCFRYLYDVQIASVMLNTTEVVFPSNAGVKPNFATNVEGRDVYASATGAGGCSVWLYY